MSKATIPQRGTSPQLPQGWQQVWDCIQRARTTAEADADEKGHSPAWIFVEELMRFCWSDAYRDSPEKIADLIDQIQDNEDPEQNFWSDEVARETFIATWMQRRYPPGVDPLELALSDLRQRPVKVSGPSSTVYAKIVGLAYHLQRRLGEQNIVLPQERIAGHLRVAQQIVSAYISVAVKNRFLRVISLHNYEAGKGKQYRFIGTASDCDDGGIEVHPCR